MREREQAASWFLKPSAVVDRGARHSRREPKATNEVFQLFDGEVVREGLRAAFGAVCHLKLRMRRGGRPH